jgi:NAD(P)-dependent dehydrogenase (short-subunit alcohol dehydrogenase family)
MSLLEGRVVVITGAGSGMGKALSIAVRTPAARERVKVQ